MTQTDMETYIQDAFADVGFSSSELAIFSSLFEVKIFAAKEVMMKQGDLATGLYILVDGSVNVNIQIPGSLPKRIVLTGRNIFFGEISLIEASIATATVQAEKDMRCLFLSAKKYRALGVIYPDIDFKIMLKLKNIILPRLADNINEIAKNKAEFIGIDAPGSCKLVKKTLSEHLLHQAGITQALLRFLGVFNDFNDEELLFLINNMTGVVLEKGALLTGQQSSWFIIRGAMQVLVANQDGGSQLMIMPPGKLIDAQLLTLVQGKVHCKAQNDMLLFCLDEDVLNTLRQTHPSLYHRYLKLAMSSLAQFFTVTNKKLVQIDSGC